MSGLFIFVIASPFIFWASVLTPLDGYPRASPQVGRLMYDVKGLGFHKDTARLFVPNHFYLTALRGGCSPFLLLWNVRSAFFVFLLFALNHTSHLSF